MYVDLQKGPLYFDVPLGQLFYVCLIEQVEVVPIFQLWGK